MARIVFVTTLQLNGSTVVGRVLPLAHELKKRHEVHVIVMSGPARTVDGITMHYVGQEPFTRTSNGKIRLKGWALIWQMKKNAWLVAREIKNINPDTIILVKPLPQNVFAALITRMFFKKPIILDCDDFELTANQTTSLFQRSVIHLSQHLAAKLAKAVVVATPFLQDIWQQLTHNQKKVILIPTGLNSAEALQDGPPQIVYLGSVSIGSGHRVDLLPAILEDVRRQIPTIPLVILGDGDDSEKMKAEFAKRKLGNVSFIGRFQPEAIDKYLHANTILIDPVDGTITNRAKSSYRVNLALATQIPVVTSNIGIRSILLPPALHEKFFATPGDAASYAKKVVSLLQQPLNQEEKTLLQDKAKQYRWDVLSQQYAATLE